MKSNKNVIGVDAVNKALEILNCFTEKNEALTITKIANITGDHKSRISRISKSLENFGYIRKIKSGEFKIGHTIPRLFEIYESSFNLKNSIKAELDFISSKTKETASFFVRQNDVRVCIQSSSPNKSIRHQEVIGDKKPINKGSSGHVLSAYNNLEIKDKDDVLKNGYAMTFGERDSEMASISVPIAIRQSLPAYGNEIILMMKGTSLASTVTLMDLTGVAKYIISTTFKPIEVFIVAGGIYLFMTFLIHNLIKYLEKKYSFQ